MRSGLDWTGLDWTGLDWTGLDWTGLDWTDHLRNVRVIGQAGGSVDVGDGDVIGVVVVQHVVKTLHCTALYCTILYCTVLYCTVCVCVFLNSIGLSKQVLFAIEGRSQGFFTTYEHNHNN